MTIKPHIDDETFRALYPCTTNAVLAAMCGCTPGGVKQRARRLSVRKSPEFIAQFSSVNPARARRDKGKHARLAALRSQGLRACSACKRTVPASEMRASHTWCPQCESEKGSVRRARCAKIRDVLDVSGKRLRQAIAALRRARKQAAAKRWAKGAKDRKRAMQRRSDAKGRAEINARYVRSRICTRGKILYQQAPDQLVALIAANIKLKRLLQEHAK